MKKMIIAAIILIATTAQTFAGPVVTVHIEIGRKSLGCDRFGICSTSIDASWRMSSMQYDETNTVLLINLNTELTQGKEEFFAGSTVLFEESYALPADLVKALGMTSQFTINAGSYKLAKTRTGYTISVPLR
jgi:hypothetical protein